MIGGVLVIAVLLTRWTVTLSSDTIEKDELQNLTMAYNFAMHNVLSLDPPEREPQDVGNLPPNVAIYLDDLSATNYREPLPCIVLGIYLKALKLLRGPISFGSLIQGSGARLAKFSNAIWGILLCLSVFATLKVLTGTYVLAAVGALVVGLNMDIDSLYTESAAAALLALVSFLSMMAIKTRHPLYYLLAGISMGALILTKAAFLYVSLALVVCFVSWLICRWRHGIHWRAIGLVLFLFGVTVVVGPWIGRNYYLFGTARVSERGGIVLMYRALKDQMSWTEYLGSFYYWAPRGSGLIGKILGFNAADLNKGGRLQRLNREQADGARNSDGAEGRAAGHDRSKLGMSWEVSTIGFAEDLAAEEAGLPEAAISYYHRARAERVRLAQELRQQGHPHPGSAADDQLQKQAMELILAHPIKHLLMMGPFLWRGAPFTAPILAFSAIIAIRLRRYDLIAYMLPAIAMVAFHVAVTHNIPRYNAPAQPITAVLFIGMAQALIIRAWQGYLGNQIRSVGRLLINQLMIRKLVVRLPNKRA